MSSIKLDRKPLGAVSRSRMNQLKPRTNGKVSKPSATKLPSIMSMIHQETPETSPETPQRTTASSKKDVATGRSLPLHEVNFDQVADKLRIRMQLAYYKLKTKQGHLQFRQLKHAPAARAPAGPSTCSPLPSSSSPSNMTDPDPSSFTMIQAPRASPHASKPSRRLVVSQGSLRTPVKSRPQSSRSMGPLQPIESHQNTPKSVKAARSLIDLFTSRK